MNGKRAKELRRFAKFVVDKDTSYEVKKVPASLRSMRQKMSMFHRGLIEDVSKIGVPSETVCLSPECTRSFYKGLKKGGLYA